MEEDRWLEKLRSGEPGALEGLLARYGPMMGYIVRGILADPQEAEGIQLIRRNRLRFRTANLVPVYGRAPEALKNLPAPPHAFIGGSGGRLKDILKALLEKNPAVVIAVHAVTLETAAQVMECRRELGLREKDICLVQVAKAADAGGMHLMRGQNPVYLFIFQGSGEKTTEEGCT